MLVVFVCYFFLHVALFGSDSFVFGEDLRLMMKVPVHLLPCSWFLMHLRCY